ncbi:MAG: hypothetical protein AB7I18_04835 [Candidatus Berkiella sp.]
MYILENLKVMLLCLIFGIITVSLCALLGKIITDITLATVGIHFLPFTLALVFAPLATEMYDAIFSNRRDEPRPLPPLPPPEPLNIITLAEEFERRTGIAPVIDLSGLSDDQMAYLVDFEERREAVRTAALSNISDDSAAPRPRR